MSENTLSTIEGVDAWIVPIAIKRPHKLSFMTMTKLDHVIVRVRSEAGIVGWGEASVTGGPYWSEESAESILATLHHYLAPLTLGRAVSDLGPTRLAWSAVRGNNFAKAALEMAILDVRARSLGIPLAELLGGIHRTRIPLSWSLASTSLEVDLREGSEHMANGHRIFKIKVGDRSVDDDVRKIHAIRDALGADARLRVDANQAWNRAEAFSAAAGIASARVDFLEQPLPSNDLEGMSLLQNQCTFPLMADEALVSLHDAYRFVKMNAARVFSYKVTKHGGLIPSLEIAAFARAMGIGSYVGLIGETGVGTAAYAHFAAALPSLEYGCELFQPQLSAEDIVLQPIQYEPGFIILPGGAGIGVDVDVARMEKLATEHIEARSGRC